MVTVTTKCQNCGAEFKTEYQRIGASVSCTYCLRDTVPQIPNGTLIPNTGLDLTFHDFRQLVEYESYRKEFLPLLNNWFRYHLEGDGPDTLIVNNNNEAIDPLWLHLTIQRDRGKQGELYNTAMSLWR